MVSAANGSDRRFRLFLGCFLALVATSVGFAIRADLLQVWGELFNLSEEQKGTIQGAGLYPFAISIILFSLIVDRIGYGRSMVFAFLFHVGSVILTLLTPWVAGGNDQWAYAMLYAGTFIFSLGNGIVEAVINPVVATIYERNKTHWLNILHAGWPGGLVLGSVLAVVFGNQEKFLGLPGHMWQWKLGVVLIPMLLYGLILLGLRFPVQERVAAGVSYLEMLREFGAASFFIVCFLLVWGINQILQVAGTTLEQALGLQWLVDQWTPMMTEFWARAAVFALVALVPTLFFALGVRAFGRPMFVFLLLVMFLLATTELGTDSWITDIMKSVLQSDRAGPLVLAYTSIIMFVLRFFAGPIVHRISPLGLLALSAAIACAGLLWLSRAGDALVMVFLAATCYGVGKTFFWPTTLGVVSEQYPKGGALMLNAIAGVGMLAVGVLGSPAIGVIQDRTLEAQLRQQAPKLHQSLMREKDGMFGKYHALDQQKLQQLAQQAQSGDAQAQQDFQLVQRIQIQAKQATLAQIAILPAVMFACYLLLIFYFRAKGGYKPQVLTPTEGEAAAVEY